MQLNESTKEKTGTVAKVAARIVVAMVLNAVTIPSLAEPDQGGAPVNVHVQPGSMTVGSVEAQGQVQPSNMTVGGAMGAGLPAVSEAVAVPVLAAPEAVFCVFKDLLADEACPAYSAARVIEIQGVGGETVLFVEKEATAKTVKPDRTSIVASSRIEDAVLLEEYDADDAVLLEREVRDLSGARYELPSSRTEIKRMVGFPDNAEVAKEDWIEMLRVHAEMAMSLSANASQFILDQLGLVSEPAAGAEVKSAGVRVGQDSSVAR